MLEDEFGIQIFVCSGKYLIQVMFVGQEIICIVCEVFFKVDVIKLVVGEYIWLDKGLFYIVIIYIQVCYVLLGVIKGFIECYLCVLLYMYQGLLMQIVEVVLKGNVDFVIVMEVLYLYDDLVMLLCYYWNCLIVVMLDYLLVVMFFVMIEVLVQYLLVMYIFGFIGCFELDIVFNCVGLMLWIVFIVIDVDVIKMYVRLGLGVGVIVSMVVDLFVDFDLVWIDVYDIFSYSIIKIGFCCSIFLCSYMYDFIQCFVLYLMCDVVDMVVVLCFNEEIEVMFQDIKLFEK